MPKGVEHLKEFVVDPTGNKKKSPSLPSSQSENQKQAAKGPSPWAYAYEGTQLAVMLLVGLYVGYRLDAKYNSLPWFTLGGATLGLVVGLYTFLRRVLR